MPIPLNNNNNNNNNNDNNNNKIKFFSTSQLSQEILAGLKYCSNDINNMAYVPCLHVTIIK